MTTKNRSAAAFPQTRSPRNALFYGLCALLAGVGLASLVLPIMNVANPAAESSLYVEVDVEQEVRPFSFLFGFGRLQLPLSPFIDTEIKLSPAPPTTEIRHYLGTAFRVNGHLLTCKHVADPGGKILKITLTTSSGRQAEARLLRVDEKNDLAELTSPLWIPTLFLAAKPAHRNDQLTQIGNPNGMRFVVSTGPLVAFDREQGYNIAVLDTYGGNSGGPVLNTAGEVVGMTHTLLSGSRFTGIGTLQALRDFIYPDETR